MLSAALWSELLRLGRPRPVFRPGETMLRQGDPGTHLLALTHGLAKVVRREPNGTTTWLAFRGPGDLLGEFSVFTGEERSADVVALSPCTAHLLDARRFRGFIEERGVVDDLLLQTLARLRESDRHRAERQSLTLDTRLARALLRLAELAATGAPTAAPQRLTGLTQEELAQAVGVTRNAAVSGLRRLRSAGVVGTGRKSIVITDLEELRRRAL